MENWMIIVIAVIIVILLLSIFGLTFVLLKKKNKKSLINAPFIESLLLTLGGRNNILGVEVEQRRLKISINDLEDVDFEKLKTFSQSIFITGNNIKMLFEEDPAQIKAGLLNGGH